MTHPGALSRHLPSRGDQPHDRTLVAHSWPLRICCNCFPAWRLDHAPSRDSPGVPSRLLRTGTIPTVLSRCASRLRCQSCAEPHKCTHDYDLILSDHSQPLLLLCCLTASLVTPIYHRDCSFHVAVSLDCFVTCKCSVACQPPVIKLAGSTLCATAATCAVGFLSSVHESFAHRAGAFRLPASDLDRFWSRLANERGRI